MQLRQDRGLQQLVGRPHLEMLGMKLHETHNTHMPSCLLIPAVCFVQGKVWDGVFQRGSLKTSAFRGKIDGIPVVLLRPDWGVCNIFRGGAIYGGAYNELEAYLYFSRWQAV